MLLALKAIPIPALRRSEVHSVILTDRGAVGEVDLGCVVSRTNTWHEVQG
jgi:hypothetical protein